MAQVPRNAVVVIVAREKNCGKDEKVEKSDFWGRRRRRRQHWLRGLGLRKSLQLIPDAKRELCCYVLVFRDFFRCCKNARLLLPPSFVRIFPICENLWRASSNAASMAFFVGSQNPAHASATAMMSGQADELKKVGDGDGDGNGRQWLYPSHFLCQKYDPKSHQMVFNFARNIFQTRRLRLRQRRWKLQRQLTN